MEYVDKPHITKTSGFCGGRACIAGHRIRVMDIVVLHELRGMSAKEIVAEFPGITMAEVHAALAYYFDHVGEIENEYRKDEDWARWAEANCPSLIPRELKEKLRG
jgi:uncharacterized protein (DUF433 family)